METGEGDILIILQQTHGKMDDIEDVDRQSAPTRKSLLVILFTTDSLHPNKDASQWRRDPGVVLGCQV